MDSVEICGYSPKGHGLAMRGAQRPIEVPRTLTGERVLLERPNKRLRRRGSVKSLKTKSAVRTRPFCPHFASCGGCCWQHMTLQAQRALKQAKIEALFPGKVRPLIAPKIAQRYRNKMEFTFTEGAYEQVLGLMPFYGGRIAAKIIDCHIADPWMAKALKATRVWWEATGHRAFRPHSGEGALRTLMLRALRSGQKMAVLEVSGDARFAPVRSEIEAFADGLEKTTGDPLAIYLHVHQAIRGKPTQHYFMHLAGPSEIEEELAVPGRRAPLRALVGPNTFFQPNTAGAELILAELTRALEGASGRLIDLYCGSGLLGLSQAHRFEEVLGIEIIPEAALYGEQAAERMGISNMRFHVGTAGRLLDGVQADALIIDPPRAGCEGAMEAILAIGAPRLVYVSCNPKSQAVDIAALEAGGYQLRYIQPIDQFAHTVHCESIALLEK